MSRAYGLAAGFGVGTTTAWRYVEEMVTLLAGRAFVVLDGTLIPIDRLAAGRSTPASTASTG